ncbi:MAG: DUF5067 domain-containing protein [Oscillospiraceae bacterium]|nr:DUF5067 domain-containing protein [Oscillospiraceae bacterium]
MKKKITVLLATCLLMLALTACGSGTAAAQPEPLPEGKAAYEDREIEILGAEFTDDYKDIEDSAGRPAVMVRMHFKNSGADPLYALESFGIRAYQDGTELEFISMNDSVHEEAQNVTIGLKDGAEIDCMMAFATISDSPVEVRITEPTAEAKLLTSKTFEK